MSSNNIIKTIKYYYGTILGREPNDSEIQYYITYINNNSSNFKELQNTLENSIENKYLKMIRELIVFETESFKKIRIGDKHDGGYILLDRFSDVGSLYSYGVGKDISFETHFNKIRKCPIYLYDHTVDSPIFPNINFHFKKEGASHIKETNLNTLEYHITENGDINNNNLILKMDIEGAEWNIFEHISPNILLLFQQMVIEFHWLDNDKTVQQKTDVFKKINNFFYLIHVHHNNYVAITTKNELKIPQVIELLYVRKDIINDIKLSKSKFPTELDSPNYPERPDLDLNFYPFDPDCRSRVESLLNQSPI